MNKRKGEINVVKVMVCGSHGCDNEQEVVNTKEAKRAGWLFNRSGYGWICPTCVRPVPGELERDRERFLG